ncbi:LysR family transcriptional regulator [Nocardia sp. alder85J]|uniref:LysR family transcriptional regulator n=1 Tax=Nocardia sp. alder85J TaxID=2862949 RepID=UPI0022523218|nr:LysR family transcriptional regulator [Nocardia sp. alder85J]MCX4092285.1 LysR family transcriptional regulator [Nocardia sp. alder85J]
MSDTRIRAKPIAVEPIGVHLTVQLNWLRTFVTVYRVGSFTKAAARLGMSQPAVTHHIQNLEKYAGRALFERMPNGAQPTPAAERLLRQIQGPVDALSSAVDQAFGGEIPQRALCVGGPVELMTTRVIPALSDLVAEGFQFRFVFGLADDLLQQLRDDQLDLVLSTVRPRDRDLVATPLVDEEFVLVAAPDVANRIDVSAFDADAPTVLAELPMVSYAESLPIIRRYWRTIFEAEPVAAPAIVVPDLRGVLAAVKSSAGISVLPTYLCTEEIARGEIVVLLSPKVPPINTFYLAVRRNARTPDDLRILHGHLLSKGRLWT